MHNATMHMIRQYIRHDIAGEPAEGGAHLLVLHKHIKRKKSGGDYSQLSGGHFVEIPHVGHVTPAYICVCCVYVCVVCVCVCVCVCLCAGVLWQN